MPFAEIWTQTGECLAFAHRGASAHAPENTLAAFELAADMGADGIEFDVQITADGRLIVHHDVTLGRTAEASGRLSEWKFADLRALDVGSWFGSRFAGERMPALEEVVEAVGQRLLLNVELVTGSLRRDGVVAAAVALFRRLNLFERAMISSFWPQVLWEVRRQEPRIALGGLWYSLEPWYLRWGWWRRLIGVEALHPEHTLLTPELIARAHAGGQRVHTWTVNEPADIARARALGVDMLMGDYPERLKSAKR